MFAGKTAIKKRISAMPAARRVAGITRPIAPAISQSPVKKTIARGCGTHRGVMRMRSSFIVVKCALAVKRSMTARPSRAAAGHEANADTPARPSPRKRRIETTRTNRTSMPSPRRSVLEALEDAGGAHAAADAHGDHAVAGVAALEFADDGGGKFCAGAAEGVAQGDGASVGIDAAGVEAGLLDDGQGLRGEGFVELDYCHVIEREAGELQRFGDGSNGADAEFFGKNARSGVGDKTH